MTAKYFIWVIAKTEQLRNRERTKMFTKKPKDIYLEKKLIWNQGKKRWNRSYLLDKGKCTADGLFSNKQRSCDELGRSQFEDVPPLLMRIFKVGCFCPCKEYMHWNIYFLDILLSFLLSLLGIIVNQKQKAWEISHHIAKCLS